MQGLGGVHGKTKQKSDLLNILQIKKLCKNRMRLIKTLSVFVFTFTLLSGLPFIDVTNFRAYFQIRRTAGLHNNLAKFYQVWNDSITSGTNDHRKARKVVLWTQFFGKPYEIKRLTCPSLKSCIFTTDRKQVKDADAVVFHFWDTPKVYNRSFMPRIRLPHQYWIWYAKESPENNRYVDLISYSGIYNWTMTYRNDSDVPGPPGSLYKSYNLLKKGRIKENSTEKKGTVVWFVSKCYKFFHRHIYAKELSKHIKIDVFGGCGRRVCSRTNGTCMSATIQQYKFYLAFESYRCKEYITEKFWHNALVNGVVPIVIGPPKSDYEKFTPPNSFIHVDDFESPESLARYIKMLDKNDDLYNRFFIWRTNPPKAIPKIPGQWCVLCEKLFNTSPTENKVYTDLERWWKGENYEFCQPLVLKENIFDGLNLVHYD
ncbi:4-galactosyl-N-acetylglucosaminide 3-alpha-L-fucosyltransferase FUT6-like [Branchiostoma floridae]|uniref:Fucosyltransferase n=1 Tax=Branchiostoma floridae TaxID=7739 RepID=A0A9J7KQX5_BRAFL|nr:4-galactosyl-N-acetylglucosaminide 3-alpha-L-fucosyltransferase FUT6-like [Branchiostoma floridae]